MLGLNLVNPGHLYDQIKVRQDKKVSGDVAELLSTLS